ncbi:RDD family protein [Deltaproteobacteria bacterium]|nr:RDD family protein [Deltaproteobacteria bacterium]
MNYIGVALRFVAVLIDIVIFFVIGYLIALITGVASGASFMLTGGPAYLAFLCWFLYYVIMEATLGRTVGKIFLGIRVVKTDGSPISWSSALIRNVLRIVDGLFFYLVGAIFVWTSGQRQRLGDRLAGTVVIGARGTSGGDERSL